ncbi:helix-turn-helix domain-containing protein [Streptomyces cirratus]|uniref:helix-turn-helix domain-containing protein n=1 Tax=Streptomyces cirratus TaxID=68187 RepID=UPI00227D82D2|nr:helix-turn-helix domain-containing protein [Streptomyces cirratus]
MRYPQGGGLTAERQAFRERIRMEAAGMFVSGLSNGVIAKELRVSVRSVQRWRRSWRCTIDCRPPLPRLRGDPEARGV